jgi:hypothetical protein
MTVWIVIAVAIATGIYAFQRERKAKSKDLGTVSNQWVSEHRLGHTHDPQR